MRISIVVANYNHGAYLAQNLEGVLAQTYSDWELIVVDDASQDNSRSIIERYAARDPRIKPVFQEQNRGPNVTFRTGWDRSNGSLICANAADDYISSPAFFAMAIDAMRRHPSAAGFAAKATVLDADTDREPWIMGDYPAPGLLPAEAAAACFWGGSLFIPGASALWKRDLVERVGGYDDELGPQSDYFVNHALAMLGGVVLAEEPVVVVRTSRSSYSAAVGDADYFRHHALVEKKLRALDLPCDVEPAWIQTWRKYILNGRLAFSYEKQCLQSVRANLLDAPSWAERSLPSSFREARSRWLEDCSRLEAELDARASLARKIFDEIAGPIGQLAHYETDTKASP